MVKKKSEKFVCGTRDAFTRFKNLKNKLNELYIDTTGFGVLNKPEKLYLNNSNLMYALAKENFNIGNVRETFFLNQFKELHEINLSEKCRFLGK